MSQFSMRLAQSRFALCCSILLLFAGFATGQSVELTVDQSQSNVTFSILGNSDTSSITGTGSIELNPSVEPFATARLDSLDLTLADGFSISFIGGLVSASADPNATMVSMTNPGPAGMVNENDMFDQLGNAAVITGIVTINDPFNLAGGSGPIDLGDAGPGLFDIFNAQLSVEGNTLTVTSVIDISVDATDVISVNANGSVVLTGELIQFVLGDVNCDGVVDLLDVTPFVELISNNQFNEKADINQDGTVDLLDVTPFIALLQGGV